MFKFQNLLQNVARSMNASPARRRSQAAYEGQSLEARRVPTVTATLNAAGALTLTGDNTPNNMSIDGDLVTGDVTLQGNNGTLITLNGVTAAQHVVDLVSSLNANFGSANDVLDVDSLVLSNINVNLGAGTDVLEITNTFSNPVTVNGGDGNNLIQFENVRFGNTNVTLGSGNDLMEVTRGKFVAGLTIKTGAGNDSLTLDDNGVRGGLRVLGALKVETSDGNDTVDLSGDENSSYGSINIDSGKGNDDLRNIDGRVTGALTLKTSDGDDKIDVDGGTYNSVTIEAGSGINDIDVDDVVTNTLSIVTGDQADEITIDDVAVAGAASIKTAGGSDNLRIQNNVDESDFGALTIDLGSGDNILNVVNEISVDSLSIQSGNGVDQVSVAAASRGDVTIKTGDGNDTVALTIRALGKLTVETAAGDDEIDVVDLLIVRGDATFKTGSGNDDIDMIAGDGLQSQFAGKLTIDMGQEPDDDLDIARARIFGDATFNAEDIDIDDVRFKGKAKITAKGGDSPSIDIERVAGFAGETIFEKDAEIIVDSVTNDDIQIGTESVGSKTTFKAAAKFKGVANDPIEVRLELSPVARVFFVGPAPTFNNAVRIDV